MEVWKELDFLKGKYSVSNAGRVRQNYGVYEGIKNLHKINSGYLTVGTYLEGRKKRYLVHRLVAYAFCEGYESDLVVNHKDGNRTNNVPNNLEWVTTKENIHDSMKRGMHSVKEAHAVAHKKRRKPVLVTCINTQATFQFESARRASKFIGSHENCVSRVARGERSRVKNYQVQYL